MHKKKKKFEDKKLSHEEVYKKCIGGFRYISCWFLSKYKCDYLTPIKFLAFFNDKNLIPFWNKKIEKMSNDIFLPSKENIKPDLNKNLKFNKNKWFESDFKISKTDENKRIQFIPDEKKFINTSIISRKIAFYPNKEQKSVLKELFSLYRYFYNRTIQFLNNYDKSKSFYYVIPKDKTSKKEFIIEEKTIYKLNILRKYIKCFYPKWMEKIKLPSHEIDYAIKEALDNILKCFEMKKKTGKVFNLKYKSKKDVYHTINIEKTSLSSLKNTIFSGMKVDGKYIFKNGINLKEKISKYDYKDSSISYDKVLLKFYLNLNFSVENKRNENKKVCGIDPGIKNFVTIYDDSSVSKIGINCGKIILKLCIETDIIKSRLNKKSYKINDIEVKMNANRRRNLKKALRRKIKKIENIKDELHKQTVNYLTKNYSRIILPPFESQKIDKIISKSDTRILKCLSYYKFKERIKEKAKRNNIIVDEKEEYYTSKTCTKCGRIDYNLRNKNEYKCVKCNVILERDYNGARNILLRNY